MPRLMLMLRPRKARRMITADQLTIVLVVTLVVALMILAAAFAMRRWS